MINSDKILFYSYLGQNIKNARERCDYTQSELAALLDLSRPSIVNIEKGRQAPPLHLLIDISIALKINYIELIPDIHQLKDKTSIEEFESNIEDYAQNYMINIKDQEKADVINALRNFIKDIG